VSSTKLCGGTPVNRRFTEFKCSLLGLFRNCIQDQEASVCHFGLSASTNSTSSTFCRGRSTTTTSRILVPTTQSVLTSTPSTNFLHTSTVHTHQLFLVGLLPGTTTGSRISL
jgi:hypothetical protein